jgi:phosphomannomutase / phosphoglucomutase
VARKNSDRGTVRGAGPISASALWRFALLPLMLSLAGLLVGAALLWAQLIDGANRDHASRQQSAHAAAVRDAFESRLAALRSHMELLAQAQETKEAIAGDDRRQVSLQERRLGTLTPFARRMALFTSGSAAVDLESDPPVSFAALDLIHRAEAGAHGGPEAFQLNGERLFYVTEPVTDLEAVGGVLLAAISMEYFAESLGALDPALGRTELVQRFQQGAPATVLQYGEEPAAASEPIRLGLSADHWFVVFRPNPAATTPLVGVGALALPLLVMAALVLGGIILGFSRLIQTLVRDLAQYCGELPSLLRGRVPQPDGYRLSPLRALAASTSQAAADANPVSQTDTVARNGRRAEESPVPDDVQPPEPAVETAGDFLDVQPASTGDGDPAIAVSQAASGIMLDPLIFRAYDIRGIVETNLTEDVVYWIGRAFGSEARAHAQQRAVIGGDGRLSSPALRAALAKGIQESGVDVIDVGQVPTPVLYYATHALETGTGVIVTGSHNPPEYNGLKLMIGGETLAEDRIQRLRERIEKNELTEGDGICETREIIDSYIARVVEDVAVAQSLKVVVDCGNGVAGDVAPALLSALGCEVVPIYCDVDGTFPNHHPDPAETKNLEDLIERVKIEQADVGLAFDGDGDRLGVVTSSGAIVWPDRLMMLFSRDIVGRNPGADIIFDVKCSRHLSAIISEYGGRPIMWKTGHSHMKAKLRETGALLAGEFSGHICFGERWYGFDDALYSAARLLEIVAGEGQTLDQLVSEFPSTFMTPEIKVHTTEQEKFGIVERLTTEADFGDGTITSIDGIRVDYADGWGLIRPSNTSPVLTLRFEADDEDALARIQEIFQNQLQRVAPALTFLS